MEQEIVELEQICTAMYETGDASMREHAQKVLINLVNDIHVLQKCQLLFQRAVSPYSLLIAASTLTKRVTKPGPQLTTQERLDIRNYVLNYLYSELKHPSFVEEELSLLYARITKLSWFDSNKEEWFFRNVIENISKFLQDNDRCILGIHLLNQLVSDMNRSDNVRPLTRHRKISASFRDSTLFEIFQLACRMLSQALVTGKHLQGNEPQCQVLSAVLQLTLTCLTFDFLGTSYDESGDDLGSVQVPTGWRSTFVDLSTSQLFFNLYSVLPMSLSSVVMSCLVQIVSVRRSLFNAVERGKFLNDVVKGIKGILENPQKLYDESTFHEFCRLLARLKSNYQLGELVKAASYPECMQLVANFTVTSLRMWHFSPNSMHYLLSLWQKMASSVPYVKAQEPHHLEKYMPEILKAYMESRLSSAEVIIRDGMENPLDDMGFVKQQLEQISSIARCEYTSTCELFIRSFDDVASQLEKVVQNNVNDQQMYVLLAKLAWIIHLVAAVIGGRVAYSATDEHDTLDGQLIIRVLQLMTVTDQLALPPSLTLPFERYSTSTTMQLLAGNGFSSIELAFLSFFDQFRKIYVGDQVQKSLKVYKRLREVLRLNDEASVLSVFVSKIITNLKYWGNNDVIIMETLGLLCDLSLGFSTARKLAKLEAVQFLLETNPIKHFPFLGSESKISDLRCRTNFYTSLGRLLIVDLGEDEERFLRFMAPMAETFQSLEQIVAAGAANNLNTQAARTLIGITRDIRGLAYAFNTKNTYAMLFNFVYPSLLEIFQKALKIWSAEPEVTTPLLKLFGELVLNRGQRLVFDVSSPNGILLFREASKAISGYGEGMLALGEPPKDKLYSHRLKGILLSFRLLKNALSGSYVNFGVFRLYSDPALDDALNMFVKMVMAVESSHLLNYPKLSTAYHSLLEVISQDHMSFVISLPAAVIYHLVESITSGLNALDTAVCTCSCAALDNLVSRLFRILNRSPAFMNGEVPSFSERHRDVIESQREQHFLQVMRERPAILQKALSTIFHCIMFEDCRNQWSMSRPLLGLIFLNEEYIPSLQKSFCEPSMEHGCLKIEELSTLFRDLMDGIEKNLQTKTRDRFTHNLAMFRRGILDAVKPDPRNHPPTNDCLDLSFNSSSMMT